MEQVVTNQILYDGIPAGRIIGSIKGRTIEVYKIPRKYFEDCELRINSDFSHLNFSGIYILIGNDENDNEYVYIGKGGVRCTGEGIIRRIKDHNGNERRTEKLDDWKELIVLTSINDDLDSALCWLESELIKRAKVAKRVIVKNKNDGSAGNPTQVDIISYKNYFDWAIFLITTFGYKFLEPKVNKENKQILYLNVVDCDAKGQFNNDEFVIFKGSKISSDEVPSCPEKARLDRIKYKDRIKDRVLQDDLIFESPSGAAQFATGRSVNGYINWKDDNGKTLREIFKNGEPD